jgi:hypothetical protein
MGERRAEGHITSWEHENGGDEQETEKNGVCFEGDQGTEGAVAP